MSSLSWLSCSQKLTHFFTPEETNPSGNVHGGSILRQLELAGWLAAQKHVTAGVSEAERLAGSDKPHTSCITARLEHVDFNRPVMVGALAEMEARVTYTSDRSIRVHVDLHAADVIKGTRGGRGAAGSC